MRRYAIAAGLLLCTLGGCATTNQEMRDSAAERTEAQVAERYQVVYRRVLAQMRKCHAAGSLGAEFLVDGQLYDDTRSGEITAAASGMSGYTPYLIVDISEAGAGQTRMIVSVKWSTWKHYAPKVIKWAEGTSTKC